MATGRNTRQWEICMSGVAPQDPRWWRFNPVSGVVGIAFAVTACGHPPDGPDQALAYAERVETTLGVEAERAEPVAKFPRRRDRMHTIDPVRVSLGQWSDLEDCEAGALIAQANSPLGKVRSSFERVRHSHALVAALDDCQETMTAEEWAAFQPDRAQKAAQLDEERWNAVWVSDVVERSFGRTTPLAASLRSGAFEQWTQLLAAVSPVDDGSIDSQQWYASEAALDKAAGVGEAFQFMLSTTAGLNRVASAVERSRNQRDTCMKKDREVLAVMRGHYANKIQPMMAKGDTTLRSATESLTNAIESLRPSDGVPVGMRKWVQQWGGNRAFEDYRTATRRHAAAIGRLIDACGEQL